MPNTNQLANQVIKLIEDGKKAIDSQSITSEVVLFIGMTGSGKSTLINYLSGKQLESFSLTGGITYRLRVKAPATELPGITIGHSTSISCTKYPVAYRPSGESYSYIDTPGFGDTGRDKDKDTNGAAIK